MSYSKPLNLIIEGALLASEHPLSLQDIANLFDNDKPSKNEIQKAIDIDPVFKDQGEFYIKEIKAGRNP